MLATVAGCPLIQDTHKKLRSSYGRHKSDSKVEHKGSKIAENKANYTQGYWRGWQDSVTIISPKPEPSPVPEPEPSPKKYSF